MAGIRKFAVAYIKSMRLYYAFVTGIAGWVGVAFYQFLEPQQYDDLRCVIVLIMLFLSWGVNQIINDYLGLPEDRINAPNRPMVTGELNIKLALTVTGILLAATLAISYLLNPLSVIPAILGILLNIVYEYAKGKGLLGNVVFGVMIATCTAYGFLACGKTDESLFTTNRVTGLILVAIINGLMTYYTYFKDYHGDKLAGKETFIVRYGVNIGRYVGVAGAFISAIALGFFMFIDWLPSEDILYKETFFFCCIVTFFLQCQTAYLYFAHPHGERTYFSLVTNIRACVAGQVSLIAIFNGQLALYLLIVSYILIGFFFDMYKDTRS